MNAQNQLYKNILLNEIASMKSLRLAIPANYRLAIKSK